MPWDSARPGEEKKISPSTVAVSIRKQTHDQMMLHLKDNFPEQHAAILAALKSVKEKKKKLTDSFVESDEERMMKKKKEEDGAKKPACSTPKKDSHHIDDLNASLNECSL